MKERILELKLKISQELYKEYSTKVYEFQMKHNFNNNIASNQDDESAR